MNIAIPYLNEYSYNIAYPLANRGNLGPCCYVQDRDLIPRSYTWHQVPPGKDHYNRIMEVTGTQLIIMEPSCRFFFMDEGYPHLAEPDDLSYMVLSFKNMLADYPLVGMVHRNSAEGVLPVKNEPISYVMGINKELLPDGVSFRTNVPNPILDFQVQVRTAGLETGTITAWRYAYGPPRN